MNIVAIKRRRLLRNLREAVQRIHQGSTLPLRNAFCPTGPGGGQDNSCSPTGGTPFNRDADHHATAPGWADPPANWRQRAYGGVVFKFIGDEPAFLLREPANHFDGYHWTFPKGKLNEEHENPLHAAAREVLEETGRETRALGYVPGTHGVSYPDYQDPKTGLIKPGYKSSNYFFLMKSKGKVQDHDNETWKTRWATESEAKKLIAQSTNKQGRERDLGILKAAVQAVKDGGHKSTHVEPPKGGDKPTKNEAELVENPFVSEAQRRACFAKDDPAWDCHEWAHATPKGKKLPERKPGAVRNLRKATRPNPLRYDPTQTATIRRMFEGLIRSKFSALKRRVIKLIVEEDALGLTRSTPFSFTGNAFCPTGPGGGQDNSCSVTLHGTAKEHLQSILENGITASSQRQLNTMLDRRAGVFLLKSDSGKLPKTLDDLENDKAFLAAKFYAHRAVDKVIDHYEKEGGDDPKTQAVVLVVKVPKSTELVKDREAIGVIEGQGMAYMAPTSIPKEWIHGYIELPNRATFHDPKKLRLTTVSNEGYEVYYVPMLLGGAQTTNAFCPTGEGGGVDPSCPGGLYHGTPGKNLQAILKNGLKAGKAGHIFAADSEMEALDYAIMQAEDHKDASIAILRVDPKGFREFETPVGDVYLAHPDAHLPPDRIKSHTLLSLEDARARRDEQLNKLFPTHNTSLRFIAVVIPNNDPTTNAFCPTGPGGGQDNSCSPGGGRGRDDELDLPKAPKFISSQKANVEANNKAVKELQKLAKKGDLEGLMAHEGTPSPKLQAYKQELIKAVEAHQSKHGDEDMPAPKSAPKEEAPAPAPKEEAPKGPPIPDPKSMEFVKSLPGSTHPKLMVDSDGKKWVVKQSDNESHLRNEAQADATYRAMGIAVPHSGMVEGKGGPAKVSEFLDGKTLADWGKGKKPAEIEAMHDKIGKNMAADALMGNYDVVGLSRDNVFISHGVPYRVDNGGALAFRAQGLPKGEKFGTTVGELDTLRNPSINAASANVFKNVTDSDLKKQIGELSGKRQVILDSFQDKALREKMGKRLDSMEKWAEGKPGDSGKAPPKPPPAPAPMPAVSQVTKPSTPVGKGPKTSAEVEKVKAKVLDEVRHITQMSKEKIKAALTGDASPNHAERAAERMKITDAIYKNNLAVPNAINHVLNAQDKGAIKAHVESITTGEVHRAIKEYSETPLHDLTSLSKIIVQSGPAHGQANCQMGTRALEMGSTSVTGDFRHELGHAIRSSWGGSSWTGKSAMTEAVAAEYKDVMKRIGGPEGAKAVKALKLSHEEYETKYGVVGKRGPDNWEENAAEHYRLYHREVYRDRNEGGNGKYLAQYRERHPGWAKIWDAHYTAAMLGQ